MASPSGGLIVFCSKPSQWPLMEELSVRLFYFYFLQIAIELTEFINEIYFKMLF